MNSSKIENSKFLLNGYRPFNIETKKKQNISPETDYWITEDGDYMVTEDGDKLVWRHK